MGDLGQISDLPAHTAHIILTDKRVQEKDNGIPVYANASSDYVDSADIPVKVVGHCEFFDLSKEEDRNTYADLSAKLAASLNLEKSFEQHVIDKGTLFIYLAYLEYIKVVEGK